MANPLVGLRNLMIQNKPKTTMANVISIKNSNQIVVLLSAGNAITVWGTASVGDSVLIKDGSVVASIDKESITQVFVP